MTYSVAIRTLGTNPNILECELRSIYSQSIQPESVILYIAEGYCRPEFQIGNEEYVWVKKGMVAQRALDYHEIASDCILLLDDDVELAPDSVERMMRAMEENRADCVGADTFKNQDMSIVSKVYAGVTNLVFPHWSRRWAFKIHANGSFSYNNNPSSGFYESQSCAGPCSLWKKDSFLSVCAHEELWLERLGFWFGEDVLLFYKLHVNGGRLGILYDSGVKNLDGKSASGAFQKDDNKFYVRSFASFLIWHRTIFAIAQSRLYKLYSLIAFIFKAMWLFIVNVLAGLVMLKPRMPILYIKGLWDGCKYVRTVEYKSIPSFRIK